MIVEQVKNCLHKILIILDFSTQGQKYTHA